MMNIKNAQEVQQLQAVLAHIRKNEDDLLKREVITNRQLKLVKECDADNDICVGEWAKANRQFALELLNRFGDEIKSASRPVLSVMEGRAA